MADPTTLDESYLRTRQATDQWQAQMLEQGSSSEPVRLEAQIPAKPPSEDMNAGNRRSDEELAAMGLDYASIGRKEFTVESPEIQAIRQQAKEHAAKLGTGQLAAEEVGKAGRKLADALHPGVMAAGRALGLDEEGANALAEGFVQFMAGLPGNEEGDTMAGVETALAALPAVGMAIKGGKVAGKALKGADAYLNEMINFGGIPTTRGDVIKQMQKEGTPQRQIDAYMMAQKPITWNVSDEFKKAVELLKSERGSVPLPGEKLPGQAGGANISSNISPPPGSQAPPSSLSTLPEPSGSSTYRSTAPSTLTGPMRTTGESTATPPTREIIQPSKKVKELLRLATEGKPTLDRDLAEIVAQTPGMAVVGTRVKSAESVQEKLARSGRSPDTVSDYLGGRISIDTPATMEAAIAAIKGRYPTVEFQNFLNHPKAGYRAVHMQVKLPNGLSAEIQLVPKPIADIQEETHLTYQKWRGQTGATPEQNAAYLADYAAMSERLTSAYEQWIEKGTVAEKVQFAGQRFEERLQTFSERLSKQRRGVRSDVQVTADSISPEALNQEALLDLPPGTILKDSDVVAAKRIFKDLAEPVRLLAKAEAAAPTEEGILALLKMLPTVDEGLTRLAGAYAESGRTQRLLSSKLPTGGMIPADSAERVRISDEYLQQWLAFFQQQDAAAKMGAPALTKEKLIAMLAELKSPEELLAAAKVLAKPSKWDMFTEYWINGLLSGPQTHATNIISNAATLAWGIPERQLAAMFSSSVRPSEASAMLRGIVEAQGDAFRLAWKAFKEEESQLGVGKLEGATRAITADALELTGVPGRAVDFMGAMIRLPGRFLLASDDYFKAIAFRAEVGALANRTAYAKSYGAGLTGKEARVRYAQVKERILQSPPDFIDEAAKEFAAYVTFTRELGPAGQAVQSFAAAKLGGIPIGRLVLPFVRTPGNIFKYAGERTPFALASRAVRDEIAAGGDRRALALAKLSMGSMTMAYAMSLAGEGVIEGGGPKDKALRQIWLDAGHLPYSVRVGDTRYSFARIEPVASLFGAAADMSEIMGQLPEKDAEELAAAVVVALQRNISNKTFIKGLAGAFNAASANDINAVKTFFEKELPTILPYSTGMGQLARELDPTMREVNSIIDAYKAKVPGYSDELPPHRNLWGEPILLQGGLGPDMITPIYTSTVKHDPVSDELVRLEVPITMPSKTIEGVPLDPAEYDAYVVLQGAKPIIGGVTLKERLAETMQSELYKRASGGPEGGKSVLLRQWINAYREQARQILDQPEEARKYLGRDFPDLQMERTKKRAEAMTQFNAPVETR